MSSRIAAQTRRVGCLAAILLVSAGISACGRNSDPTSADTENIYVNAGQMTYQVQISRQLNPFSTEDSQYLAGIPKAQSIPGNQLWYGVFLWAKNQSGHYLATSGRFQLVDSSGRVYKPWPLNPLINPYAWAATRLPPDGVQPVLDSTASNGPTQGSLILFRLSDTAYANRPLTLDIFAPGQSKPSTVSLDL